MRDEWSRQVEQHLRPEFPHTDAYRYNSASIRVRVIDDRFEGKSDTARDTMVERILHRLPEEIQAQIFNLITLSPSEIEGISRQSLINTEFENPSPSRL